MHDGRPAGGGLAEVDDVDDLGRRGGGGGGGGRVGRAVVEDVLEGADALGAAEGARGDAVRARGVGDGGVGFVVCPWWKGATVPSARGTEEVGT